MSPRGHVMTIALLMAMAFASGNGFGAVSSVEPDSTCSLTLNVTDHDGGGQVNDSTIYLYLPGNTKVYKTVAKEGKLVFQNLTTGEYGVMAEKTGFINSFFKIAVDCASTGTEAMVGLLIPLWKSKARDVLILDFDKEAGRLILKDESQLNRSRSDKSPDQNSVRGGVIAGRPLKMAEPEYPEAARKFNDKGTVEVEVTIGYDGRIESAKAIKGPRRLREAAENAALKSVFAPTFLDGAPVVVIGVVVYNFQ